MNNARTVKRALLQELEWHEAMLHRAQKGLESVQSPQDALTDFKKMRKGFFQISITLQDRMPAARLGLTVHEYREKLKREYEEKPHDPRLDYNGRMRLSDCDPAALLKDIEFARASRVETEIQNRSRKTR